jgi:tRNA(Ile)-lysidine synthase
LSPNAASWSRFCESICNDLGVQLIAVEVQVSTEASVEAAARTARYQALLARSKAAGAQILLTAHHANDQAETVLLNILRGTGVPGLRGIAQRRSVDDVTLLRPLLVHPRSALETYAATHGLRWIDDESNAEERFRRNKLRHRVMPVLTELAPDLLERLGALARHARSDAFLLDELAQIDFARAQRGTGLDVEALKSLDTRRAANLMRYWLKSSDHGTPSEAMLTDWLQQLRSGSPALNLELAQTQFAIVAGVLDAVPPNRATSSLPPDAIELHWRGESVLQVPEWHGLLHFEASGESAIAIERLKNGALTLRSRSGGERMQLAAHAPSRTLKNLYQEAGIAQPLRPRLPLIYCDDDLVFAAGLGMNLRQCTASAAGIRLRWVSSA